MQGMTLDMYLEPLLQNINISHSYSSIDGRVEIGFGSGGKENPLYAEPISSQQRVCTW